MARWALYPPRCDADRLIGRLVDWAQIARRDGALALEARVRQLNDPFMKSGLQMLVDGFAPDQLREALDVELAAREETQRAAVRVWESAGGYAPTIGIIGAVLGLIHVMENLADPTRLGAGHRRRVRGDVYGLVFANLVLLPIAGKLRTVVAEESLMREMTQEALVGIAAGEHPSSDPGAPQGLRAGLIRFAMNAPHPRILNVARRSMVARRSGPERDGRQRALAATSPARRQREADKRAAQP